MPMQSTLGRYMPPERTVGILGHETTHTPRSEPNLHNARLQPAKKPRSQQQTHTLNPITLNLKP